MLTQNSAIPNTPVDNHRSAAPSPKKDTRPSVYAAPLLPTTVLDLKDLKSVLRLGHSTIYQWMANGKLPQPSFRLGEKSPRWIWADVEKHIRAQAELNNNTAK